MSVVPATSSQRFAMLKLEPDVYVSKHNIYIYIYICIPDISVTLRKKMVDLTLQTLNTTILCPPTIGTQLGWITPGAWHAEFDFVAIMKDIRVCASFFEAWGSFAFGLLGDIAASGLQGTSRAIRIATWGPHLKIHERILPEIMNLADALAYTCRLACLQQIWLCVCSCWFRQGECSWHSSLLCAQGKAVAKPAWGDSAIYFHPGDGR